VAVHSGGWLGRSGNGHWRACVGGVKERGAQRRGKEIWGKKGNVT
jgi:hypothetical protein